MRRRVHLLPFVLAGVGSAMLLCPISPADAQVTVGISFPGINIGVDMPVYPEFVEVPGYPVYYDPRANSNYFFYDGLYWVYRGDDWYMSSWYNGPWQLVGREVVPLFVLRIPVRYYRQPPVYFRGWDGDAPPRWGEHWGRSWEERRGGWDRWDRRSAPPPAPLPVYQRQYSGDRYPRAIEQQHAIRSDNYRYEAHEAVTRQYVQQQPKTQPVQPAQVKQPQAAPQQARENRAAPQPNARESRVAPQVTAAPQQARENKAAPQGKAAPQQERENKAVPQGNARESPAKAHGNGEGKGRENKNEEHGQDRR